MIIPTSYPSKPPEINFITKLSHPCIDLITGKLDITVKLIAFYYRKNSLFGRLVKILSSK